MTVLAVGEVLWDMLPSGKLFGGAPANFTFRLNEQGIPTKLISRVGVDALGNELINGLQSLEFDTSFVQRDEINPTGTVDVTLTPEGNPHFEINPNVAYDHLGFTPALEKLSSECTLLYFGTLIQRSPQSQKTVRKLLELNNNKPRFLDINLRKNCYSKESVQYSLEHASILKMNSSEIKALSKLIDSPAEPEPFSQWLFNKYPTEKLLVTLGEDGAMGFTKEGEVVQLPGLKIQVADTIGAGDSFSAGFVSGYLKKKSFKESLMLANCLGAAAARIKGGMSKVTSQNWEEISALAR